MTKNFKTNRPQVLQFDRRPNKEEMLKVIDRFRQSVAEGNTLSAILISIEEDTNNLHATFTSARPVDNLMLLGALSAINNKFSRYIGSSDEEKP